MNEISKEQLKEVLTYCRLTELPQEWDGESLFLKAIVAVSKADGSKSYAIVEKDELLHNYYKKDFGNTSAILSVDKVYPFFYFDVSYIPDFDSGKKRVTEEFQRNVRIEWLKKNGVNKDFNSMTLKEIFHEVVVYTAKMMLTEKPREY